MGVRWPGLVYTDPRQCGAQRAALSAWRYIRVENDFGEISKTGDLTTKTDALDDFNMSCRRNETSAALLPGGAIWVRS